MTNITVLSKPACVQCTATYRGLDSARVEYETGDLYSEENLALVKELGYMQAPVVLARDEEGNLVNHWSGFRPDKIAEVAQMQKAA